MIELKEKQELAIAISYMKKGNDREILQENLNELSFLIETAGATVIEKFWQELERPNRSTLIGKGKVEEIKDFISEENIDLAVFDDELTPMQIRNLEDGLGIKVMDRSGVILDIFAERAKSNEAKTQVELAQLQYLLPRLTRMWTHLSKQHGGIGTKGPGETQIETDRRLIRTRIEHLKRKLDSIEKQSVQKRLSHKGMVRFGLVGYTNAGKSTLMKLLTQSNVYIKDKLFATLDTTVRKFQLPEGQDVLLSDTVGFIKKLPTHLVASFRSTLSEARESDYLLHVVDVSNEFFRDHINTVDKTLLSLGIEGDNIILIFNKIDLLEDMDELSIIKEEYPDSIYISASKGLQLEKLRELLQDKHNILSKEISLKLPYEKSNLLSDLYQFGEVLERIEDDFGFEFKVRVKDETEGKFIAIFDEFVS
ncbi:GTPase HflX [Candidatus Kapabacteria bacterium]|nr:GTPase HflX [Candidatus Kapabacteria bacterium]